MLHQKLQSRISTYNLKQIFTSLLSHELESCGFDIMLSFEASFKKRLCSITVNNYNQIELCINLEQIHKVILDRKCSLQLKVFYTAFFLSDFIKQMLRAKKEVPQNYFEGLVFLNAVAIYESSKANSIYSPLTFWGKKTRRTMCIHPIEISCATTALNKILLFRSSILDSYDKAMISKYRDYLLLYSSLPEISYQESMRPIYSIVSAYTTVHEVLSQNPNAAQLFPIFSLLPFDHLDQLSTKQFFLHCVSSDNGFLIGTAVRIISFLQVPLELSLEDNTRERLFDMLKGYIEYSISYYNEMSDFGGVFFNDNMCAIKIAAKSINEYLLRYESFVLDGNIHYFA